MKKLFNIQSLLIFISILILSFYYNKAELLSKWATVAITILFFVISLIYMYVLLKHGKQYKKSAVKFALIMCGVFTIFFVRPYFEGSVLDYKFNKYQYIGIMNGEVTDVNNIPILSDKETLTEYDYNYLDSIANHFDLEYWEDFNVHNKVKQGDDFIYAIEIRRRNELFDYEKYLVTMDSDYNVTNSLKISSEYSEYINEMKVIGANTEEIFFYIKDCHYDSYDECRKGSIQSIDANGNILDYFILDMNLSNGDQLILYDNNIFVYNQPIVVKYDLDGNKLIEKETHPLIDMFTGGVNFDYYFMHIFNDNIYVLVNNGHMGSVTKYTLDMEQIDQTLFVTENSHSSSTNTDKDNYFYGIYEDGSNYLVTTRYKNFVIKKDVGGEEIYIKISDQMYYVEDSMFYRSGNGLNYFEHKKLILNPILYINAVLFLLIILFEFISLINSKIKAENERMLKRRIEFQNRHNRVD